MKAFTITLTFFFTALSAFCQYRALDGLIFLGKIDCQSKEHYLDSTKRAYNTSYLDKEIHNSRNLIDISLSQRGTLVFEEISARLYWDSTFKLYYTTYRLQEDGKMCICDTVYPPHDISLDSLFSKIVEAGLFRLPLISTEDLVRSWKAVYLSNQGELSENNNFHVYDGSNYLLTYKVNNCYGQYIFNNPDGYQSYFTDNPVFKSQVAIVNAIMSLYNLQIRKCDN